MDVSKNVDLRDTLAGQILVRGKIKTDKTIGRLHPHRLDHKREIWSNRSDHSTSSNHLFARNGAVDHF